MKRWTALLLLGLAAVVIGPARADLVKRSALSKSLVETHIHYLASDELGGRGVGSEGIAKAADYIAASFAKAGLQPGGAEGSYFQCFQIPTGAEMTKATALSLSVGDITPIAGEDFVPMAISADQSFDAPAAFVGYGVSATEKGYDDYAGLDVSGKALLMFRREPPAVADADGSRSIHANFTTKAGVAKDHGAAAVLIVDPPSDEPERLEMHGRGSGGNCGIPMFHVTRKLAERILAAGGQPPLATMHARIQETGRPASGELANLRLRGNPGLNRTTEKACNVIGVLPGLGPQAKEFVVFGGHFDHLGNVPPTRRPPAPGATFDPATAEIHNGADDNASGTAGVMELARIFASGPRPARSLMFIAFTGEEIGLLGSQHFVDHPTVPLQDIVAMFNMDMIGRLESKPLEVLGARTAKEFQDLVNKHGQALGMDLKLEDYGPGNSDHSSFYNKQIPVLFAFTGVHADYHRPTDDVEKLDLDGQMRVLELLEAVADDIIAAPQKPTYQEVAQRSSPRGDMPKVRLGIMPSYADDGSQRGWGITGVTPGGAAEAAGMKSSDRILSIDGKKVATIYDYMEAIKPYKPGDVIEVVVLRGDQELPLKVTLEGRSQ